MTGPLALLLAPLAVVGFEDRVETRVRSFADDSPQVDLVESARLELSLSGERNTASLAYAPMLLLLSVGTPEMALGVTQSLDGTVTHTYRRGFVSLQQSANLLRNNLRLTLVPQPASPSSPSEPAPAVPPPPGSAASGGPLFDEIVWFGSTRTQLALGQTLSPRLSMHEYVSYAVHGSLGSGANDLYPRQHQQGAGAGLNQVISRRDTLTHGADIQRTFTSGRAQVYVLSLRETWAHAFSNQTSGQLSAGVAHGREVDLQAEDDERLDVWLPVAEGNVTTRWARGEARSSLGVTAGVAPTVDWFSGRLDQRVHGTLGFSQERRRFTWTLAASALSSVDRDAPNALSFVALAAGASQRWTRELSVDANINASRQLLAGQDGSTLWMVFAGLTYRPNPWRL